MSLILNQYFILLLRALGLVIAGGPWLMFLFLLMVGSSGDSYISFDSMEAEDFRSLFVSSAVGVSLFGISMYLERRRSKDDPFAAPPE
jgi:hypothetical protein